MYSSTNTASFKHETINHSNFTAAQEPHYQTEPDQQIRFVVDVEEEQEALGYNNYGGKTNGWSAFLLTTKAFVGTGILFLPKAYTHAGLAVASFLMVFMAFITLYSILSLLKTAGRLGIYDYVHIAQNLVPSDASLNVVSSQHSSRNDIVAAVLVGNNDDDTSSPTLYPLGSRTVTPTSNTTESPIHQNLIENNQYQPSIPSYSSNWSFALALSVRACLIASQIGFACAYLVFVAENLAFISNNAGLSFLTVPKWLLIQLTVYAPLSLVRNLAVFSRLSGVANGMIGLAVVYILYHAGDSLASNGYGKGITLVEDGFTKFLGTAIFAYEGIGMILPIQQTMRTPSIYPKIVGWSVGLITVLFTGIGLVCYLAWGIETQTIVLMNLPRTSLTVGFQLMYTLSIMFSFPVVVYPILHEVSVIFNSHLPSGNNQSGQMSRLMNRRLLTSQKRRRTRENIIRVSVICVLVLVALAGSKDLDKFVSLVGSITCIPLTFVFPAIFEIVLKQREATALGQSDSTFPMMRKASLFQKNAIVDWIVFAIGVLLMLAVFII